jgi:hypothetical protein
MAKKAAKLATSADKEVDQDEDELTESEETEETGTEYQKKIDWAVGAGFTESQAKFLAVHFGWEE